MNKCHSCKTSLKNLTSKFSNIQDSPLHVSHAISRTAGHRRLVLPLRVSFTNLQQQIMNRNVGNEVPVYAFCIVQLSDPMPPANRYYRDKSGEIDANELSHVLELLGYKSDSMEAHKMLQQVGARCLPTPESLSLQPSERLSVYTCGRCNSRISYIRDLDDMT